MADYWGANWRNFQRGVGLNSTPREEVTGGLAGGLRDLSTPPAATAPNVYGITTKPVVAGAPPPVQQAAPAPESVYDAGPPGTPSQVLGSPLESARFKGGMQLKVNTPAMIQATHAPGTEGTNMVSGDGGSVRTTSGSAFPKPGSTLLNAGNSAFPQAVPVSLERLGMAGNQRGTTRGYGFEFSGTAADAAKFMAPVGGGPQVVPSVRMIQARSTSDFLPQQTAPALPQQTAPAQAPIDFASMDNAGRRFALQNALLAQEQRRQDNAVGIASMQEQGAGARAMLVAKNQQDANNLGLRRLVGDAAAQEMDMEAKQLGIDAMRRTEAIRQAYTNEQDPVKKRELGKQLATLQGKDTSKFQIVSKKGVGPDGFTPIETSYAVNPDNPAESFEIGSKQTPLQAPAAAIEYLKKNPGQSAAFKQKYGYLPE